MKIYEKPMAIIETIEVEDVITASVTVVDGQTTLTGDEKSALADGVNNVVVFQW